MRLKAISRTATFAWDQSSSSSPLIATGAVAGALDESFSNDSQLEIWAPDFGDPQATILGGEGSQPKGSITVNSRFNRLAWSTPSSAHGRGVLAAGMETGEINVFDPAKILAGESLESARVFSNSDHTGPVRGLDFNPIQKNLMLSGGVNAELYIFDLNNPTNPIPPGSLSTRLGEITSLQWNPTVSRIFAASSSSGYTSVWDLRVKKEIASLQYGGGAAKGMGAVGSVAGLQMGKRRGMSDVAWHPEQATQLITASEDDESPIIMLWDLRNTRAPERILTGHHKGVLSVSWCKQDSDLLLSTGKDNRTLVWNPQSGEIIGELPSSSDWSFQTAWCPRNPDLLATASFDGRIGIHSLQTTHEPEPDVPKFSEKATADDIFAGLSNQPEADTAADILSLKQPPKWLRRPVAASFGFGGLLATTSNLPGANGKHQSGVVHLRHVVTESGIVDRAQRLHSAAGDKEQLEGLCSERAGEGEAGWKTLQTLFKANSTDELVQLLGFSKEQVAKQVAEATAKFMPAKETDEPAPEVKSPDSTKADEASDKNDATKSLFDEDAGTPAGQSGDFFSSLSSSALRNPKLDNIALSSTQRSDSVAATIGSRAPSVRSESLKDNEFSIYPAGESEVDKLVTQALVLGDFASAVELCLASERFADALLLSVRGGADLLQSTQKAYFARRTTSLPFLRVFQSIVTEDLADIVQNADLAEWKSIFVVVCTYAKAGEFNNLADQLGQRLLYKSQVLARESDDSTKQYRQDATLCFLAARRLEKVVGIWTDELREEERSSSLSRYTAHAQALQSFMEKVSVFTAATGYVDEDLSIPTESAVAAEAGARTYRLAGLYDRYYEYADLLATQGLIDIAAGFVKKTPSDYKGSGAAGNDLEKTRDRLLRAASITPSTSNQGRSINGAYKQATPSRQSAYAAQPIPSNVGPYGAPSAPSAYAPSSGVYLPPQQPQTQSTPSAPSIRPPQPTVPALQGSNAYVPAQSADSSPYNPSGPYSSDSAGYASSARYGQPPATLAPPPRSNQANQGTTSPPLPASQRRDMPGWNDAPNFAAPKRPVSASREAPKPAPIMSPFPQSQQESQGFPANIHGHTPPPPRAAPPGVLPPPPKGGPRPPSAQALARSLGPAQAQTSDMQAPPVPQPGQAFGQAHVTAPPPPRGPPRGAPAPGVIAGPPPRALSPLGPQGRQPQVTSINQAMQSQPPMASRPTLAPAAPPASAVPSQPPTSQSPPIMKTDSAPPASAPVQPAKPTYPAGDRSHIPQSSQAIYSTFNGELQRVNQANLPPAIKRIADDTNRRLSILFDQLNNDSIPRQVLEQLSRISEAISKKDSAGALAGHVELVTSATGEMAAWVPGVKQLIRLGV